MEGGGERESTCVWRGGGTQYRAFAPNSGPWTRFKNKYCAELSSSSEEGSHSRLIDFVSLSVRLKSNKEEKKLEVNKEGEVRGQQVPASCERESVCV